MRLAQELNTLYYRLLFCELETINRDPSQPRINYISLLYLNFINYQENCTATQLARGLNVSNGAVTLKIEELVRQGLVERERYDGDRRMYHLHLTQKGKERYLPFKSVLESFSVQIAKHFSAQDIDVFCRIARTISAAIKI